MSNIPRRDPLVDEGVDILEEHFKRCKFDYAVAFNTLSSIESQFVNDELGKCLYNPRYYLENYHIIKTKQEGFKTLHPFFDSQEIIYAEIMGLLKDGKPAKVLIDKARQLGSSTLAEGLIFHKTAFSEAVNTLIVAQDPGQADYLFSMSTLAYENMPWWMKPMVRYKSKGRYLMFDSETTGMAGLNSWIGVEAANKLSGVSVGKTVHCAHLSELSSWDNAEILTEQIFPAMPDNAIAILESTARGRSGFWYNFWVEAVESWGDGDWQWKPIFVEWFRCREYSLPIEDKESFKLTEEESAIRKNVLRGSRFLIPDEQFMWRRVKRKETIKITGDDTSFLQEYPCLIGSTRVPTEFGIIPIADCRPGMKSGAKTIQAFAAKGVKKVFRAVTHLGYEITGTADHIVPTMSGDCELSELIGRIVTLDVPQFAEQECVVEWSGVCGAVTSLRIDKEFARFLGYFMGDGCYLGSSISIACDAQDEDVVADVDYLLRRFFGNAHHRRSGTKKGCNEVRVGIVAFKEIMQRLGIWNENGRPHRKVKVPECIWRSPREVIVGFLRGLFESDGFNAHETSRVNLFSKHWDFLRDIQILLLGFGITARRGSYKTKNGVGFEYVAQSLDLRSAEARSFNRQIGFVGDRKRNRSTGVEYKVGRPQAKIRLYDAVTAIVPAGEEEVYDITVEPTNLFSANGIIVHNCTWQESFQTSGLCAFPKKKLQELMNTRCCDPMWFGEIEYRHGASQEINLHLTATFDEKTRQRLPNINIPAAKYYGSRLRVWEWPEQGESYYVGADPAHGIEGGDFSCAQILRIGRGPEPDVQVAEWRGWINPTPFGHVLVGLAKWYNMAEISLELNAVGEKTNMEIFRILEYPNLFRWKHYDKVKNFYTDLMAWITNHKTRDLIITNMRERIMENTVILYSHDLLDEMLDFSAEEEGERFEGQSTKDDRVMAAMICLWCAHDSDYGKQAAAQPRVDTGKKKYYVIDPKGRICMETDQRELAEREVYSDAREPGTYPVWKPGWSISQRSAKQDFANSDFSPVHDRPGPRNRMHYAYGIPAESIRLDNIVDLGMMPTGGDWRDY